MEPAYEMEKRISKGVWTVNKRMVACETLMKIYQHKKRHQESLEAFFYAVHVVVR